MLIKYVNIKYTKNGHKIHDYGQKRFQVKVYRIESPFLLFSSTAFRTELFNPAWYIIKLLWAVQFLLFYICECPSQLARTPTNLTG